MTSGNSRLSRSILAGIHGTGCLFVLGVLLANAQPLFAASGDIVNIGLLNADDSYSVATAINDDGVVVGYSYGANWNSFRWTNGVLSALPSGVSSYTPVDINNAGVIALSTWGGGLLVYLNNQTDSIPVGGLAAINESNVGVGCINTGCSWYPGVCFYKKWDTTTKRWVWQIDRLDTDIAYCQAAFDINNSGVIVGQWFGGSFSSGVAGRYTDSTGLQLLGTLPNDFSSQACSINDNETIVGTSTGVGASTRIFKYTDSIGMQELENYGLIVKGGIINLKVTNADCILGNLFANGTGTRPTTWDSNGNLIDLNSWLKCVNPVEGCHWWLYEANGLNNNGIIVGYGFYSPLGQLLYNSQRGFVLDASSISAPSQWNVNSNGNWSDSANWKLGLPNSNTAIALLGNHINQTTPRTITVDTPVTLRALILNGSGGFTIDGSNALTFESPNGASTILANSYLGNGSHTISAPITLANELYIFNHSTGVLTLSGTIDDSAGYSIHKYGTGTLEISHPFSTSGTFDIGDGALTLDGGDFSIGSLVGSGNLNIGYFASKATLTVSSVNMKGTINVGNGSGIIFGTPYSASTASGSTAGQAGSGTLTTQGNEIVQVPEPGTWVLLFLSFSGIFFSSRMRK